MISLILLVAGAVIFALATLYYIRDCRFSVSPSMGGEMTFSALWNVGATLFFLGLLPTVGFSRWWSLVGVPLFFGLSFLVRSIIARFACRPYVNEPTGYQKFIRKIESNRSKR